MSWNSASELVDRYRERHNSIKTGSISIANEIRRHEAALEGVVADPEKLKDFEGGLNAFGGSVKQAKARIKAFKTIQAAIDAVYPPPEPEV